VKFTAITREGSTNTIPDGVPVKKVNYDSHDSLVAALKGHDALLITMSAFAPPETSGKLIAAAKDAGVQWIIPNEFGNDGRDGQINKEIILGSMKTPIRRKIEELGMSWVGIACGFWYEFSLAGGPDRYGFDFPNKKLILFDEGEARMPTSTFPQTGLAVARTLALKIFPEDENDKSLTLDSVRNSYVDFASFNITQKEMFASVLRVTGDKESDWTVTKEPAEPYFKDAVEQLQKTGNRKFFGRLMYVRLFFPDANWADRYGLDNEKLGLPKEDVDEFTKIAIQMDKDGYFEQEKLGYTAGKA
jgi:NmrA-like family protein